MRESASVVGEFSIKADKQEVPMLWEKESNIHSPGRQQERRPSRYTLPKPTHLSLVCCPGGGQVNQMLSQEEVLTRLLIN